MSINTPRIGSLITSGPANADELDQLADFIEFNETTRGVDRYGPAADAVLVTAAVAAAAGAPTSVAAGALIAWVGFGMWQNAQLAKSSVRSSVVRNPEHIAEVAARGGDGRAVVNFTQNVKSASLLTIGALGILLLSWNAFWFAGIAAAQAAATLYRHATIGRRLDAARRTLDIYVSTTQWAQHWQKDRTRREAAAERFLNGTR